jgi:hypothetical protein
MEKRLDEFRKDQGDLDKTQGWFIAGAKMTKRFDIIEFKHGHSAKISKHEDNLDCVGELK